MDVSPRGAAGAVWPLDPAIAYLNHGGFGVTPRAVRDERDRWRARIERNPSHFLTFEIEHALRAAMNPVAKAVHVRAEDVVFIENATSGLNAVMRSLDFEPGDEILVTSLGYPAIGKAARYAAARSGACVVEAAVALPVAAEAAILDAVAARLSARTRLAIFDHVASHSALTLPVAALTRLAHEAGARVMIDGAHAPGMVPLDVPSIGAEWYVGNLHKWYFAPRSCGFLWASSAVQTATHPLAISHGYREGFRAEFEWTGTRDLTAALAAPAAIEFHESLGGAALMKRNTEMARAAAEMLARRWRTELAGPVDLFAAMASVRLPLGGAASEKRAQALMRECLEHHGIAAAFFALDGALWARIAAQAYNSMAEYERLGAVVAAMG